MTRVLTIDEAWREWAEADLVKAGERAAPEEDPPVPPDSHRELRRRLGLLLAGHGEEGAPLHAFREHVQRHGKSAVARALRDLGHGHRDGRIVRVGDVAPAAVKVSAPERRKKKKKGGRTLEKAQVQETAPGGADWRPLRFRGVSP